MTKSLSLTLPIVLLICAMFSPISAEDKPTSKDVSVAEAATLIKDRENLVILDIRTKDETDQGIIGKEALLIDFFSDDFKARVKKLDTSAPYLLHCASGGRSGQAIPILKELGFTEIYHLKAGFMGWKEAGMPVVEE